MAIGAFGNQNGRRLGGNARVSEQIGQVPLLRRDSSLSGIAKGMQTTQGHGGHGKKRDGRERGFAP